MTPTLLSRVHRRLDAAGIRSALIGAVALAAHGVSRSTLDQDLLVADRRALDDTIWSPLGGDTRVDIRRGDTDDPLAGVVRITATNQRDVDVIVARHAWQAELVDDAMPVTTASGSIPVVSPGGLVLLKLYAGGPQDLWDIAQLRAVLGRGLDEAVEARLAILPPSAQDAWRRLVEQG